MGGGLRLLILLARKRRMRPRRNGAMVSGSYSRKYMIPPMHRQKRATCKVAKLMFLKHQVFLYTGLVDQGCKEKQHEQMKSLQRGSLDLYSILQSKYQHQKFQHLTLQSVNSKTRNNCHSPQLFPKNQSAHTFHSGL